VENHKLPWPTACFYGSSQLPASYYQSQHSEKSLSYITEIRLSTKLISSHLTKLTKQTTPLFANI